MTSAPRDAMTYAQRYVAQKTDNKLSAEAYLYDLRLWSEWCAKESVDPLSPGRGGFQDYLVHVTSLGQSANTSRRRLRTVMDFLTYLFGERVVSENPPLADLLPKSQRAQPSDLLTLDEIASLIAAAPNDNARAGFLLITVCFLSVSELTNAEMDHLTEVEGRTALVVPTRTRFRTVVVPDQVFDAIRTASQGRVRGPLVVNQWGGKPRRQNQQGWIDAALPKTSISREVSPILLNLSARVGLMEAGVSYGSVVRGVPTVADHYVQQAILGVHRPISEHPSYRLARMLVSEPASTQSLLDQAETLAGQHDVNPAAAIALASGVIERHLRDLAGARGVEVRDNTTFAAYAQRLYEGSVIRLHHKKQLDVLGGIRNDADHGWFDRVSREQATEMVVEARKIIAEYPIRTESSRP